MSAMAIAHIHPEGILIMNSTASAAMKQETSIVTTVAAVSSFAVLKTIFYNIRKKVLSQGCTKTITSVKELTSIVFRV